VQWQVAVAVSASKRKNGISVSVSVGAVADAVSGSKHLTLLHAIICTLEFTTSCS
jgi:hypothetical protein